ncbi:HEAT repeat domain-containing protein [Streptomyces sp. NPDC059096]|uniref:HEAT repeat domain-containing protein n=1 Tax=Streptomyces sp. NPDC059096 TaxID=3346727 RepID=UPI0036827458
MKTPTDPPFPETRARPPAHIGRLVQDRDPRTRHRGLVLLAERLAPDPVAGEPHLDASERAELAALLPRSVTGPPESALVLAELYERLGPYVPEGRRPSWRTAGLPERVRIVWLRAELHHTPEALRTEPPSELLYQAVRDLDLTRAHRPRRLLAELAECADRVVRAEAVRLARQGLHAGLLAPALVRAHLAALARADDPGTATAALTELAEPWAALEPLTIEELSGFLATGTGTTGADPGTADAALLVLARHGHREPLRRIVADPAHPPGLRRRAMELLGALARRADIDALTALAARDPLLLGSATLRCLRGLHRRGHFPAPSAVPALVALALADHTIEPGTFATVLFTCRREVCDALTDAPVDDAGWPRRLALLVELARQGTGELPIGDTITRLLPSVTAPEPFLAALRALRHTEGEEAVIACLPSAPAAALDALEALGGERTVRMLADGLGLTADPGGDPDGGEENPGEGEGDPGEGEGEDERGPGEGWKERDGGEGWKDPGEGRREPDGGEGRKESDGGESTGSRETVPALRAVRHQALDLLWSLNTDPGLRSRVLSRLDPTRLPSRIAAGLGGPDERELALLRSHLDPSDPLAALLRLAAHGGSGTVPILADLLLRVVAAGAASWEPGADQPRPGKGPFAAGTPTAEPAVPQDAVDALCALGGRLYTRRAIRPVCLLDAADAREAGHALVATMALDLLDRPGVTDGERTILLKLLLAVPSAQTRPRVHHLLRHRDRHVRKHVIALLAADGTGDDARALSASLIALTTAGDIQTVRQALLALGHARARWAAPAIAACLDRPNMNIKKTAAEALARAGTPAAVPALLRHLGRTGNPGLRAALLAALRAVLGDAYQATLLAAAERAPEEADRVRLLAAGLDGVTTARSVLALADQASPVVPALLALVADGRVRLASGSPDDLAEPLAAHGIGRPAGPPRRTDGDPDADARSLVAGGWHAPTALRVAERLDPSAGDTARTLRPMLADWLRLADSRPDARERVVRFTLRICPAPWTDHERRTLAHSAGILLAELAELAPAPTDTADADSYGRALVAVLEAAVPTLPAGERAVVADAVRALPPAGPGTRAALSLLRACDAVLVRADLDRALAAARLAADPRTAQLAVLGEAFAAPPAGEDAWCTALEDAVHTPAALNAFRHRTDGTPPGSRVRLAALAEVYPDAGAGVRAVLLDWMTALQPLGTPPWTRAEDAAAPPPAPRIVHGDDLDQPRSHALRTRLLALLAEAPGERGERGDAAARTLLTWPEPETAHSVLHAFLRGRVTVPVGPHLADALTALAGTAAGRAELDAEGVRDDRLLLVAGALEHRGLEPLLPVLLDRWEHGPPDVRRTAARLLRRVNADTLAACLEDRLDAGAWGFLDLLVGRTLLRTPALTRTRRRLRAEGRAGTADELILVTGPLRGPGAVREDAAALAALRARPASGATGRLPRPSRRELMDLARTGTPEGIRRALTRLAEEHRGPAPDRDPELIAVIAGLLTHPRAGVRLRAHRISRTMLDRTAHLRHTAVLLDDPQPDIQRMAIRTLCHAPWEPAIPTVVERLAHPHPVVRAAAAEGLAVLGARAVPALRRAAAHARPDRRPLYTDVLDRITATGPP